MLQYPPRPLTAGALLLLACAEPRPPPRPPTTVTVLTAAKSDVPVHADFIGTVEALANAEIRARTPGYLEAIHYQEGKAVKKGDLLFTIDPVLAQAAATQAQGSLADARAALTKADTDLARARLLFAQAAITRVELDAAAAAQAGAQARLLGAEGALQSAKATLGYTRLTSPIDGVAGEARVRVGNLVGQGEPTLLTTVSSIEQVRVRFTISEQQYLKIAPQLARLIATDGGTGRGEGTLQLLLADGSTYGHRGAINIIDRQLDRSTGTLGIEALLPNPDLLLRPGQFGKVRAQVARKEGVFLVPQRAIRELQGSSQLGVVGADRKVEVRTVVATDRVGSSWVIEKGLAEGDQVIVEGLMKVRNGEVVSPVPAEEKKAP